MTKQEKEAAIINALKALPRTEFGEYRYTDDLRIIIAKVMNYEVQTFRHGEYFIAEREKVAEIIKRMTQRGIIKTSKTGLMFKVTV